MWVINHQTKNTRNISVRKACFYMLILRGFFESSTLKLATGTLYILKK